MKAKKVFENIAFERNPEDIKNSIGVGLKAATYKNLQNQNVKGLVKYLNKIKEFKKYKTIGVNASDIGYTQKNIYSDVPLEVFEKHGIDEALLDIIQSNTYEMEGQIEFWRNEKTGQDDIIYISTL